MKYDVTGLDSKHLKMKRDRDGLTTQTITSQD